MVKLLLNAPVVILVSVLKTLLQNNTKRYFFFDKLLKEHTADEVRMHVTVDCRLHLLTGQSTITYAYALPLNAAWGVAIRK